MVSPRWAFEEEVVLVLGEELEEWVVGVRVVVSVGLRAGGD